MTIRDNSTPPQLANAGAVVCTVTLPDNSTDTPPVTNPTTGTYEATHIATQAGRHTVRWVATGLNASAYTDAFDVDAGATGIVSLADVKAHLNITRETNDEELRTIIDAATEWVESRVGPVARRTITTTLNPAGGMLWLQPPVISLTSVTSAYGDSTTYDTSTMYLDTEAGFVRYGLYGSTFAYPVTVTYVAGRVVVPSAIRLATLMIVKSLWETQRGASPLPMPGGDETAEVPGMGLAVWRAEKLLEPYILAPAVA